MGLYADFFAEDNKLVEGKRVKDYVNLIRAMGDRGVIRIDARLHAGTVHGIAREECVKRGYLGYQLYRGSILRPHYFTEVIRVDDGTPETMTSTTEGS